MYLEKVRAKGKVYLYLKKYDVTITYSQNKKVTLYSFGRLDKARKDILEWQSNINSLPDALKELGCTEDDIGKWVKKTIPQYHKNSRVYATAPG